MTSNHKKKHFILFATALLAALFSLSPWGVLVDNVIYDTIETRIGKPVDTSDIVIVGVDEPSFQQLQQQWPWPRTIYPKLLEQLARHGAKVVAFDLLFSEPSNTHDDKLFAEAIEKQKSNMSIILGLDFKKLAYPTYTLKTSIPPLDELVNAGAKVGHVSIPVDHDSFVRRIQPSVENTPSLAFAAVQLFNQEQCCKFDEGDTSILIDFSSPLNSIRQVSFYQALNADTDLPNDTFKNKLVFIGVTSTSVALPDRHHADHYPTPLSRQSGFTAGVIIHGYIAATLLNQSWNDTAPRALTALLGLILAALFIRWGIKDELSHTLLLGLTTISLLVAACLYGFLVHYFYIPKVSLLLPTILVMMLSPYYNYSIERKRKKEIRKAFSTYVNESIVKQIENDPESLKLGGKQVDGTVLFMDLAGFSTLSETESPQAMISFINDFLSAMIEIGMNEGGTVERFLGDAIMLIWGAPVEQENHAELACTTAIKMQAKLHELTKMTKQKYGFEVSARIGINSGSMTAGNIGGKDRFCYTVLGDSVNLAARFEAASKIYKTTIIIGESTLELIDDRFYARLLDITQVKGRNSFEKLYELIDYRDKVPPTLIEAHKHYIKALDHLKNDETQQALEMFQQSEKLAPHTATSLMISRCVEAN